MVITSCTRNAVVLYRARGFESHTLRQKFTSTSGFAACGFFHSAAFSGSKSSAFSHNCSFSCKERSFRTLPYALGVSTMHFVSADAICHFLMRLLPMPNLSPFLLHPQRTNWNYSPDEHMQHAKKPLTLKILKNKRSHGLCCLHNKRVFFSLILSTVLSWLHCIKRQKNANISEKNFDNIRIILYSLFPIINRNRMNNTKITLVCRQYISQYFIYSKLQ